MVLLTWIGNKKKRLQCTTMLLHLFLWESLMGMLNRRNDTLEVQQERVARTSHVLAAAKMFFWGAGSLKKCDLYDYRYKI